MKRLIYPISLAFLFFTLFAIPKVELGLSVYEEKGWMWAKPVFVRVLIDFVFAWIIASVIWMQLNRSHWLASVTFCTSTVLVSVFWIPPLKHAPQAFRDNHPVVYNYLETKPIQEQELVKASSIHSKIITSPISEPVRLLPEELPSYFKEMIGALYHGKGRFVLNHGDMAILEYARTMRTVALEEGSIALRSRGFTDQMFVLSLRHYYSKEQLLALSDEEVFFHAINKSLLALGSSSDYRIDYVDIAEDGQSATAEMIIASTIPEEPVKFAMEDGVWRMSLLPLIPARDEILTLSAFNRGITVEELIFGFIGDESGRTPSPVLWEIPE